MNGRPSLRAHVMHCEPMNPQNRLSKAGKAWQMFKVHCVLDLGEAGKRVCQLVNGDPVQPGLYDVMLGLVERDGRSAFMPEEYRPVASGK